MQREISNALSFAISKGYQIHPDAFAMLKGLDIDILKVVQDIVKMKIKHKESSSILVEDIKNLINPEGKVADVNSFSNTLLNVTTAAADATFSSGQHSYKVILDPTPGINSGEGIRGYTALFRSRFEKSLRILALRPDSKRITKITSLKHKSNNAKLRKTYDMNTDANRNSSVIAGLLMSKRSKKNGVEMVIDDHSGMPKCTCSFRRVEKTGFNACTGPNDYGRS